MNCTESVAPVATGQMQNETVQYVVDGKTFIVEPIFKDTSNESIGTLLMKLMKSDCGKE